VSEDDMGRFIETINIPDGDKEILRKLKPWNYVGLAGDITKMLDKLE
jgi:hypothetical protein